jgi:biopolymer transport protein ExbB/TolQ
VKAVAALLALVSVACWAIILEKTAALRRLRREAAAIAAAAASSGAPAENTGGARHGLAATTLRAGVREWREGRDEGESRAEFRDRMERAMRAAVAAELRAAEPGLPFLATTGATAPFIGLFGTVWGIMNSFAGIAASNDTSLAVVAPGIAEALFVTALGLVAAIPAVVAYNRLAGRLGRVRAEAMAAAAALAARLARRPARALHAAAE